MTDYTKTTNFTAKDTALITDPAKILKGSEFDLEFNAIATAISSKFDSASSVDINGGAIDGTTIGSSTAASGAFSSMTAATVDINGGTIDGATIDGATIGGTTAGAGTFTSMTAATVDINGGTADGTTIGGTIAAAGTFTNLTASGTLSFPDNSISGDDVDGGTISNFASTGIDDNATSTAITIDSSERVGFNATAPVVEVHIRDQNYGGTLSSSTPVLRIDSNSGPFFHSNSKIELKAGSGTASIFRYSDGYISGDTIVTGSDNYLAIEETGPSGKSGIRINDADLGVGLFTAGSASSPDFKVDTFGHVTVANNMTVAGTVVKLTGLPTSDPASAGQLWNDSGTLKISAG